MTRKNLTEPERLLTHVELELMRIIWTLGECSVRDVLEDLPQGRELAYTSVATVMKILEKKKILSSRKTDTAHIYSPRISRDEYESKFLNHAVHNIFEGTPSSLVMRLLNETDLSKEDLKTIRNTLDEKLKS